MIELLLDNYSQILNKILFTLVILRICTKGVRFFFLKTCLFLMSQTILKHFICMEEFKLCPVSVVEYGYTACLMTNFFVRFIDTYYQLFIWLVKCVTIWCKRNQRNRRLESMIIQYRHCNNISPVNGLFSYVGDIFCRKALLLFGMVSDYISLICNLNPEGLKWNWEYFCVAGYIKWKWINIRYNPSHYHGICIAIMQPDMQRTSEDNGKYTINCI